MQVTLLGLGGAWHTLSGEAREALEGAGLVVAAERLLNSLPDIDRQTRQSAVNPSEIMAALRESGAAEACVVFSGDTGFFSGARRLVPLLDAASIPCRVLPGPSSVQLLAARLRRPWQDWVLRSAHGAACDPVPAVMQGRPAFFLTGGTNTPAALCAALTEAGLGTLRVTVGENLSYPDERVVEATAAEAADMRFAPLSVLLAEAAPRPCERTGGIPDEAFLRGSVPMTKQFVRAAILSALGVTPDETVWDVGAGTGSVSVELALAARRGRVYAVERGSEACELILRNREAFHVWNLALKQGEAPEALRDLPAPDAVFIGGSGGRLAEIVDAALVKNPAARLCLSAVTLETVSAALALCAARGLTAEAAQLAVARTKAAGGAHLLTANNPVFLITAKGDGPA